MNEITGPQSIVDCLRYEGWGDAEIQDMIPGWSPAAEPPIPPSPNVFDRFAAAVREMVRLERQIPMSKQQITIQTPKPVAHASDCATNNMPAMPAGKCGCGAIVAAAIKASRP